MPIRNTINFILLILVNALVLILISKIDGDFSIGVWYNVFLIVISKVKRDISHF